MRHTEYDQYDHSRARECLSLALGFLMNYGELWSSNRVPIAFLSVSQNGEKIAVKRMPTRRLRFRIVAVTTSNHIDISTYRHGMSQGLLSFAKTYIIYDVISFQKCSNSGTFTFDVMNCFQICLFRNHHI